MSKTRVLVIDDSALMRQLLRQILAGDPDIEVVGAAPNPIAAWDHIQNARPDVITLDVEMPKMDGLEFLEKLMRARPMPVVMVSSLTEKGCATTLRALELGAVDFVAKPKIDVERGVRELSDELISKVKNAARARPRPRGLTSMPPPLQQKATLRPKATEPPLPRATVPVQSSEIVLAIGASTGGTEAIRIVLQRLPANSPGIVIVQHMPAHFTRQFADRVDKLCALNVREAEHGDRILPGHALIAPGGSKHMEVTRSGGGYRVHLFEGDPVNHSRPSVDVLFASCARVLRHNAVGAILTGMGGDGADGLLAMRKAGARTVAQDEASSVVFGMPKEAIACGAAEIVLPLAEVGPAMMRLAQAARDAKR